MSADEPTKLCEVCKAPIPVRPYQRSARTCGPKCARRLAHQEDPTLDGYKGRFDPSKVKVDP